MEPRKSNSVLVNVGLLALNIAIRYLFFIPTLPSISMDHSCFRSVMSRRCRHSSGVASICSPQKHTYEHLMTKRTSLAEEYRVGSLSQHEKSGADDGNEIGDV